MQQIPCAGGRVGAVLGVRWSGGACAVAGRRGCLCPPRAQPRGIERPSTRAHSNGVHFTTGLIEASNRNEFSTTTPPPLALAVLLLCLLLLLLLLLLPLPLCRLPLARALPLQHLLLRCRLLLLPIPL